MPVRCLLACPLAGSLACLRLRALLELHLSGRPTCPALFITSCQRAAAAASAAGPCLLACVLVAQDVDPETRNLRDGEYVGVRRFVRILEQGPDAKATVDKVRQALSSAVGFCCLLGEKGGHGDMQLIITEGTYNVNTWGARGLRMCAQASRAPRVSHAQPAPCAWVLMPSGMPPWPRRANPCPHPVRLPLVQVIDACGVLINLRTAIMRYRKPKTLDKFFR